MQEQNVQRDAQETALKMIRLHGLRAQAVALERAAELRQQHDPAGHDQWQPDPRRDLRVAPYGTARVSTRLNVFADRRLVADSSMTSAAACGRGLRGGKKISRSS
jgi:hypothetical protein